MPMVSAPFSASFMLPVPEASVPAVEDSREVGGGMMISGIGDVVVGMKTTLEPIRYQRVVIHDVGDIVDRAG